MGRILVWALLAAIVYAVVRTQLRMRASERAAAPAARAGRDGSAGPVLQCAYCGIHFPQDEKVVAADGRNFCSADHARLAVHADPH